MTIHQKVSPPPLVSVPRIAPVDRHALLRRALTTTQVLLDMAYLWRARARQRRALARLDARLLNDIGLTPDDVRRERCKFFWEE